MPKIFLILGISFLVLVLGCGSSTNTQKNPEIKQQSQNQSINHPKMGPEKNNQATGKIEETKKLEQKTEPSKTKTEISSTLPSSELKTSNLPTNKTITISGDWVLLYKLEGKVEKEEENRFLEAVKEKWLKGPYTRVTEEELYKNLGRFEGKKILRVELISAYGEYEVVVRSAKVEKENGEFVEHPLEQGPDGSARGQASMDDVIKEIRFMK